MQATAVNHQAARQAALDTPPTGNSGSGGSSDDGTTITANDFLTLLVAEMKNQDPTSDQDPNAYIDQLVQVNSLQQLIQINQDLGTPSSSTDENSQTSGISAVGATGGTARAANTAAAVSAARERLQSSDSVDAAGRLESALAPKNGSSDQPLGYSPSNNHSGATTAAGFEPRS